MTFLTTRPPDLNVSPRPETAANAEEMIARGAGLDAARPGQIGGNRAADRAGAGLAAEQRGVIHRLEGEFLLACRHQRFDLGERRSGLRREHKLLRLVKRDAGKPREIERRIPLRGAADRALGAAADDFEVLPLPSAQWIACFDFLGIARVSGCRPSGAGVIPAAVGRGPETRQRPA